MKHDIYLAFIGLSIGWGMHASLAARFCLRCASRKTAIKLAKFSQRPMPRFCMNIVLTAAIGWMALIFVQDIASVFGWKPVLKTAVKLIEQLKNKNGVNNGRKKT